MKLSKRVEVLTPSTTLAITAKAKELAENGVDMIGLGAGEPDFNTPQHIIDSAYKSMNNGLTKYTPAAGLPQLKDAIINKLKRDQGLTYNRSEVMIGCGAKHVLYLIFQAILDEGDEVIIPIPYWVSYPEQVKLAGGNPIYIEGYENNDFKVTPEQVEKAITSKTKAIIINSPSNPTGMIYSADELKAIGDICLKHNILIVSDEIYEKLVYGNYEHVSIAQLSPKLKENTIIVNGVSKSHSMTGWRIGYGAGNKEVIEAMVNLASHSTSNPTTTAQYATITAYNDTQEPVEKMRVSFEERLEKSYPKLLEIPGFTCVKPQGAFYFLPNATEATKLCGYENVDQFAEALLEEAHVAVIPGSSFGIPTHIRLSYATSQQNLDKALDRIRVFIETKMHS
ncbi:MAG: aspartate aminotransferase [Bacillales bacterium]|jgi:aspartate aminotransferase|nr:aspartate aminotransferase [Bacillales bacterium]